ncbi:MAG: 30S ribosomal protein S8 [Candidatus Parcubacteria bacterium]|nr:MAG: 30S ribosomal protein S8 [Candidatus Parcubacteria bacterium]
MTTDPIADLLTQIRNAWKVKKEKIVVPYSNVKIGILKIFKHKNIIKGIKLKEENKKRFLVIYLNYNNNQPPYENLRRISKPGRRVYVGYQELKPTRSGFGFKIISTSRGIMVDSEAKKRKLGGEVLCEIY